MLCQIALYSNQVDWIRKNRARDPKEISVGFGTRTHFRTEVVIRIYCGLKSDRYLNRHIASIIINSIPRAPAGEVQVDLSIYSDSRELRATATSSQEETNIPCEVLFEGITKLAMSVESNPTALIFPDFEMTKELFAQLNFADL